MSQRASLVEALTAAFQSVGADGGLSLLRALYALARGIAGSLDSSKDIEDVVSITAVRIVEMQERGTPAIDIANQIPTILRNATIDLMRRKHRTWDELKEEQLISTLASPDVEVASQESLREFIAHFTALGEPARLALGMKADGASYAAIRAHFRADLQLEYTLENLAAIVSRARARLRTLMREYFD